MNEGGRSWEGMVGAVIVLYWGAYFTLRFFTIVGDNALVLLLIFCAVVGVLLRIVIGWVVKEVETSTPFIEDGTHPSISNSQPLPFFVKGQVRRRKLDLTRSSNFIKDSVSTKQKRQLSGILRKRKKKGGR